MALTIALAFLAGTALANDPAPTTTPSETWRIDPTESEARFRVRLFGVVPIGGRFTAMAGRVEVDRARSEAIVRATLAAESVKMLRRSHSEWAKSAEFFDAANHPEITFVSHPLPLARLDEGGPIEGQLTLRGLTREVTFELVDAQCDLESECRVDVTGQIDRSAFGMNSRRGTLADRVSLKLHIVAERT